MEVVTGVITLLDIGTRIGQGLHRLPNLPNVEECKKFFDTCAELKCHAHPPLNLEPDDWPDYYLPSDQPKIKWETLTSRQQDRLCSYNLFDSDVRYEINRMSPLDLITHCNKLDKLERAEAEAGQLNTVQQVQKAAYKVWKLWATIQTGQREVTAYDWALLNASHLVMPMYSGSLLFWPDGDYVKAREGNGGER